MSPCLKLLHYFFDDIMNIKIFDPNNIKIDEKLYKNILIYYIVHWICDDQRSETPEK